MMRDEDYFELSLNEKPKPGFKPHSKFTPVEDELLRSLVSGKKEIDWYEVSLMMPGRNQRQCRERWTNYLSPTLNTTEWTPEEDYLLTEKVKLLGKKWVRISRFFNNRTDQMCKNRFNILERKKLCLKRGRKSGSKSVSKHQLIVNTKPTINEKDNIQITAELVFRQLITGDSIDNKFQEFSEPDDFNFFNVFFE